MIICIGGLPGSGKSTVAKVVAEKFRWQFLESDDTIPGDLRKQIARGVRLSEEDLDDWILHHVITQAVQMEEEGPVVVASLLARASYEDALYASSQQSLYISLEAPYETLKERVLSRDHFATLKTLDFCWEARNEIHTSQHIVNANQPLTAVVADCMELIKTLPSI